MKAERRDGTDEGEGYKREDDARARQHPDSTALYGFAPSAQI